MLWQRWLHWCDDQLRPEASRFGSAPSDGLGQGRHMRIIVGSRTWFIDMRLYSSGITWPALECLHTVRSNAVRASIPANPKDQQ